MRSKISQAVSFFKLRLEFEKSLSNLMKLGVSNIDFSRYVEGLYYFRRQFIESTAAYTGNKSYTDLLNHLAICGYGEQEIFEQAKEIIDREFTIYKLHQLYGYSYSFDFSKKIFK
jgi:hypothetical protein